jgi:hypothetical protein
LDDEAAGLVVDVVAVEPVAEADDVEDVLWPCRLAKSLARPCE